MIITRAPLRISFSGGGTDLPAYYQEYGPGVVVSASINRYVYVTLSPKFDNKISIRYRIHENVDNVDQIKHALIREILKYYGIEKGIELTIISEVPARGSGLGASSALAVALCLALQRLKNSDFNINYKNNRSLIAHFSSKIEIYKANSPIGKQDHYASALGGFNKIDFLKTGTVEFKNYFSDFIKKIENNSMLYYLNLEHQYQGNSHFVQKILKEQHSEIKKKQNIYNSQVTNALKLWNALKNKDLDQFASCIRNNWKLKSELHSEISNPQIESFMERAFRVGALAAKVCGAGGGGFAYLLVPPFSKEKIRKEFHDFHELNFKFSSGAEVIFDGRKRRKNKKEDKDVVFKY